jgi:hypothetical protein
MNVTFLVTVVLPDAMDPTSIADEAMAIEDDLMSNFEVVSVTPWARLSLGLDQIAPAPEAPPPLF